MNLSFCSDQKLEITKLSIKSGCCKICTMQGILLGRGVLSNGEIEISSDGAVLSAYISGLINEIYSKKADIASPSRGGRCRLLRFNSPSATKYLLSALGGGSPYVDRCPLCQGAFLRGLFLACGRISDPEKQFNLEFSLGSRADLLLPFFVGLGLSPRISDRRAERLIYFRRSSEIEDFFALAGMNTAAFAVINETISKQIKNNVNRVTNCTTSNIEKAVSASADQISLIEQLIDRKLISHLPDELEATARLRLKHKDMSLSQLSAITSPRISKPGLSHRLKKITALAREILGYDGR